MHESYVIRISGISGASYYYAGWSTSTDKPILSFYESEAVTYEYRENAQSSADDLCDRGYVATVENRFD